MSDRGGQSWTGGGSQGYSNHQQGGYRQIQGSQGGNHHGNRNGSRHRGGSGDRYQQRRDQPYPQRGGRNQARGPRNDHGSLEGDATRFVKQSFFENPWRFLERGSEVAPFSSDDLVPALPPLQEPVPTPTPVLPIADLSVAPSAAKLGLSLPPPKQQSNSQGPSKISSFLSKLPPPKKIDESSAPNPSDTSDIL